MQSFKLDLQDFSPKTFKINSKTIWLLLLLLPLIGCVYLLLVPNSQPTSILSNLFGAAIIIVALYSLVKKEIYLPQPPYMNLIFLKPYYYLSNNGKREKTDNLQKIPGSYLITGKKAIYVAFGYIIFALVIILIANR